MKVYGVYTFDYEGRSLQTPLYKDLDKAVSRAKSEVNKLQKEVVEMQKFTDKEGLDNSYKDLKQISEREWEGGYNNWSGVLIEEIKIV